MPLLTVLLSLAVAIAVDWLSERAQLLPPGFRPEARLGLWRRAVAAAFLTVVLWAGVFGPLAERSELARGLSEGPPAAIFALHGLILAFLAMWWALGYLGVDRTRRAGADPLLLRCRRPAAELGIGAAAGVVGWLAVLAALLGLGGLLTLLGEGHLLPTELPAVIPWLAGLPVAMRLGVSLSAGLCEELFFRAFLQPRLGIALSSACFVLAHVAYEQPIMLVGVSFLSLLFAWLLAWRRSIWAAVVAHALFDTVQLLVIVPLALKFLDSSVAG